MTPDGSPTSASTHVVTRHRGLLGRTVLVSLLTLLSRLLGFAREALMAAVFGERSIISDAFLTAWRLPNLSRRLLGEGALSTSLQAAMTRADSQRGDAAGRALFLATLRVISVILVLGTLLAMAVVLVLPDRMPFTDYAWLGPEPAPVRDLMVRVLPYVVLVCAAGILGGALAVRGHFVLPNLAPTAMNVVWIGTLVAIGVASDWGEKWSGDPAHVIEGQWAMARWLAWGLLLGGLVQLGLHPPPLRRFGLVGDVGAERAEPWPVLRATGPLVLGAALYQINVLVDGLMAQGLLAAGGPSALYYANRLQQFPLALVSTAAVNAVFPSLTAHGHLGALGEVRALHDRAQLGILFLALPAAAGMLALAQPIASVCYEHGNYGAEGAARVAEGIRWLAVALIPAGAAGLTSRVYIALGDLVTPVRVAAVMVLVNVVLNATCVVGLGLDVAGLTLATALTTWIHLAWLATGLRTRLALPGSERSLRARAAKIALASLACAAAAWITQRVLAAALLPDAPRRSIPALLAALAAGGLAYALCARSLGIPEWGELLRRLRGRGWETPSP